jgi:hypothetical protein
MGEMGEKDKEQKGVVEEQHARRLVVADEGS